uniref:Uncharacterized protein n=1 Tax=viral metagenome TaxID=1070528 RepID=A0A6M3MGN5_9ZZZZ
MRMIKVDGSRKVYVFEDGSEAAFGDVEKYRERARASYDLPKPAPEPIIPATLIKKRKGK